MSPGEPGGFEYVMRGDGRVQITHDGGVAATLRGARAAEFLAEVESGADDHAQQVMARWTGNYKRGNERRAREHPRNRS